MNLDEEKLVVFGGLYLWLSSKGDRLSLAGWGLAGISALVSAIVSQISKVIVSNSYVVGTKHLEKLS